MARGRRGAAAVIALVALAAGARAGKAPRGRMGSPRRFSSEVPRSISSTDRENRRGGYLVVHIPRPSQRPLEVMVTHRGLGFYRGEAEAPWARDPRGLYRAEALEGKTVLDAGAGTGALVEELLLEKQARGRGVRDALAVDLSDRMPAGDHPLADHFLRGDLRDRGVLDEAVHRARGKFDLVLHNFSAVFYLDTFLGGRTRDAKGRLERDARRDLTTIVENLRGVLKPGGRLRVSPIPSEDVRALILGVAGLGRPREYRDNEPSVFEVQRTLRHIPKRKGRE
jgi:SAM-dependent methyltransferase